VRSGRFAQAIEAPNLLNDPDYATIALRSKNRDALNAAIGTYMAKRSTAEWIDILNTAGVPCGPINSIDQVFDDAQVKHLGIAQPLPDGGKQLVGQPFTLSHAAPHGRARRSSASRPMTSDGIRIHRTGNRLAPAEQGRLNFKEHRHGFDRQGDLAQGRKRRLRDLQQSRAPQRHVARNVGSHHPADERVRQGRQHPRSGTLWRWRQGLVAGADISKFGDERSSEEGVKKYNDAVEAAYASVHEFPPTIAMIRGFCVGGGMGIASCCDLRIASEDARLPSPPPSSASGYG
jgi:hypothetical protein